MSGKHLGWQKRWAAATGGALAAVCLASLGGCQDRFDPAVYGRVEHKLPKIKGADEPYPLPQLAAEATQDKEVEEATERPD